MQKLILTICFLVLLPTASAQEEETRTIEEIVVFATKRVESIQEVPIAVSAYSGEDLAARGIDDLYGIQQISPSVSVYSANSTSNTGTIRIRGIGTTGNNGGLESAVGTFIDGIYRSRSGIGFNDLIDIERMEVLRGPQGTLFGKNTSAGALNIISRAPDFESGGYVELTGGNLDTTKLRAGITGPLSETLAYRLAGSYHKRDEGPYRDIDTGEYYDIRDRWMLKGQLLWKPNPDLTVRLIVDYSEKDENCCQAAFAVAGPTAAILKAIDPNAYIVAEPEDRWVGTNFEPLDESEDKGFVLDVKYRIEAWDAELTSVTGYRDFSVRRSNDWDNTNFDLAAFPGPDSSESFENWSQEFRLAGSTDRVDWLFGAYLYDEKFKTNNDIFVGTGADAYFGILLASFGYQPGDIQAGDGSTSRFPDTNTEGFALFTHNIFHLTDRVDLTFGLRYVDEEKDSISIINGAPPVAANATDAEILAAAALANGEACRRNFVVRIVFAAACDNASWQRSRNDDALSGTLALAYALTDSQNIYASYSRGFKAGGLNQQGQALDATPVLTGGSVSDGVEWEEETIDSFELGYKAQFLNDRLQVNTALFFMDIEDFQLNTFTGTGFIVGNPGDAESKGIEIETTWLPAYYLTLTGGVTYADAKYDDDVELASTHPSGSIAGRNLTHAPKWQTSAAAMLDLPLSNDWNLFGNINWSWRDEHNTDSDLDIEKEVGSSNWWNSQIGIRSQDDTWQAYLWCTNCLDEQLNTVVYDMPLQAGSYQTYLSLQRMWGGTLKLNF